MKLFAIVIYTLVLVSFLTIHTFFIIYLIQKKKTTTRILSWINMAIILLATYAILIFPTNYLDQSSFFSNLNDIQNVFFMLYLIGLFLYQVFEAILLRKVKDYQLHAIFLSFLSRAISVLFFMAYLAIYTLP